MRQISALAPPASRVDQVDPPTAAGSGPGAGRRCLPPWPGTRPHPRAPRRSPPPRGRPHLPADPVSTRACHRSHPAASRAVVRGPAARRSRPASAPRPTGPSSTMNLAGVPGHGLVLQREDAEILAGQGPGPAFSPHEQHRRRTPLRRVPIRALCVVETIRNVTGRDDGHPLVPPPRAGPDALADPHLPRRLTGLLGDAGLLGDPAGGHPVAERRLRSGHAQAPGLSNSSPAFVPRRGEITAGEITAWATDLTSLGPAYFFSLNRYLFVGVRS